jgi:hypothetical protein
LETGPSIARSLQSRTTLSNRAVPLQKCDRFATFSSGHLAWRAAHAVARVGAPTFFVFVKTVTLSAIFLGSAHRVSAGRGDIAEIARTAGCVGRIRSLTLAVLKSGSAHREPPLNRVHPERASSTKSCAVDRTGYSPIQRARRSLFDCAWSVHG